MLEKLKNKNKPRTIYSESFIECVDEAERQGFHVAANAWLPTHPKVHFTPDSNVVEILQALAQKPLHEYYDDDKEPIYNPHLERRERLGHAKYNKAMALSALAIYKKIIEQFGEDRVVVALHSEGRELFFWVRPEDQPEKKSYSALEDDYNSVWGPIVKELYPGPSKLTRKDIATDLDEVRLNELLGRSDAVGSIATGTVTAPYPSSDSSLSNVNTQQAA